MAKIRDLTGQRFGRLVVLRDTGERKSGNVVWRCRCDCGNEVNIKGGNLTSGNSISCGCYSRECTVERSTIHGMASRKKRHPIYRTWVAMLRRCEDPNNNRYKYYGARGIKVCDEWHDAQVFIDWALANNWQKGLSIDRIDNDGNYEPGNCRWTTRKEQARNKTNSRYVIYNGDRRLFVEVLGEHDIMSGTSEYKRIHYRVNTLHWSMERALSV